MKATIWHNPGCGTSRKTLAILQETPGLAVTVIEYLRNPPSAVKLAQLYRDAGLTPQQGLRLRGTDAEERGLPAEFPLQSVRDKMLPATHHSRHEPSLQIPLPT